MIDPQRLQQDYEAERRVVESLRANRLVYYRASQRWQDQPAVVTELGLVLRPAKPGAFRRLAEVLQREQIEPVSYLRYHLQAALLAPNLPGPTELARPAAISQYRAAQARRGRRLAQSLVHHTQLVQQELVARRSRDAATLEAVLAGILLDTQLELSALFRFCYAYSLRHRPDFAAIAQRYAPAARRQLQALSPDDYRRYYDPLFPGALDALLENSTDADQPSDQ